MKKIYTNPTLFMVTHIQNLLTAAHIPSEIRNEYAAGAVGELSFLDAWPELWIDEADTELARGVIEHSLSPSDQEWLCRCGEYNGEAFFSCWRCGKERPY